MEIIIKENEAHLPKDFKLQDLPKGFLAFLEENKQTKEAVLITTDHKFLRFAGPLPDFKAMGFMVMIQPRKA